jgi:hypothetical protein
MKLLFNQTRPDRKTVLGHVHGISFSGKCEDAFFHRATHCTWARWRPRPERCRPGPAGRSALSRSDSR